MAISRRLINSIDRLLRLEKGTIYKGHGGRIRVVLIYPNTYHIGMSNLGLHLVYGLLNNQRDVVCERAFMPEARDIGEYIRTNTPIFSYESKTPIHEFDIIAFCLSFENDYPNVIKILQLSGIPFRANERPETYPLLIAGGACCFFNPEPIAEVFDLVFIGEAEESLPKFLDTYRQLDPLDRHLLKRHVVAIEGIYVPGFYKLTPEGLLRPFMSEAPLRVKRVHCEGFSSTKSGAYIATSETEFSDMSLIEVMRGCYWRCRYCVVSAIYTPPRLRSKELLKSEIQRAPSRVGLIAPSISDVPYVSELLVDSKVRVSITSLRADHRGIKLIGLLKGNKSISIAPEVGTDRLRKVINKGITEEGILSISEQILQSGIENLRLYFMIGLPTETMEDIEGIVRLSRRVRALSNRGLISLTVSIFIPKPFTPFQWHGMSNIQDSKHKLSYIKKGLEGLKNVRLSYDAPNMSLVQAVLARGGREALDRIIAIAMTNRYEAITKDPEIKRWSTTKLSFDTPLPWDFIDSGISKESLWEEYQRALNCKPQA